MKAGLHTAPPAFGDGCTVSRVFRIPAMLLLACLPFDRQAWTATPSISFAVERGPPSSTVPARVERVSPRDRLANSMCGGTVILYTAPPPSVSARSVRRRYHCGAHGPSVADLSDKANPEIPALLPTPELWNVAGGLFCRGACRALVCTCIARLLLCMAMDGLA